LRAGRAICAADARPAIARADWADPDALLAPADLARLHRDLAAALAHLSAAGEVRIRLVNDAVMADAHQRYSGIAGTTDVLTFDLRDPPAPDAAAPLDVDLLICVDEARRQAAARGHPLTHELLLYALHGVLHCLGHDDHDDDAFARMHALEDQVLQAIGVGPVFASGGSTAAAADEGGCR
jgi:probable rRNA maturation factor